MIVLTAGLVALGMAGYARIQHWCLYLGLAGFAIMIVLMLFFVAGRISRPPSIAANQPMFGVAGAYDETIAERQHE